VISLWP